MEYRELWPGGPRPSLLGYGGMRFPVDRESGKIDEERAQALIDRAMEAGITYYDTAWAYHDGASESFLGRALSKYPRESYHLATKLPCWAVDSREKAREIIDTQLAKLNTDYVDFYLIHAMNRNNWKKVRELDLLSLLEEYRLQGKLRWIGFSFHDDYEVFEEVLNGYPWNFCQIQLNYMDTELQAGLKGLELARSKGVPVVIMEPVKGGSLARLPAEVEKTFHALDSGATTASWAVRWVASQPGVAVLLSGMTTMEQLEDNLRTLSAFRPLDEQEARTVEEVARQIRSRLRNGCTGCRYCVPCPSGVDIPRSFKVWNNMAMYGNARLTKRAWRELKEEERPDRCVGCGRCEELCPQHISIRADLARVTGEVEAFLNG